jgi:hypothetical protein
MAEELRRNLSDKEIIETVRPDVETMGVGGQRSGGGVSDGGSTNEGGIGVPANFQIIEQVARTDVNGEYVIEVVVEFDAVPGAQKYNAYLRGGPGAG